MSLKKEAKKLEALWSVNGVVWESSGEHSCCSVPQLNTLRVARYVHQHLYVVHVHVGSRTPSSEGGEHSDCLSLLCPYGWVSHVRFFG